MKQSAATLYTLVTEQGHDTATAVTLIVLTIIALAFWAGSEFQLRRSAHHEQASERQEQERDVIARVTGMVDNRTREYDGEFADMVEDRLRVIDGGAS